VEIWFNPKCSKCRIAKNAFDAAGLTYDLRYYLEQPPTIDEVRTALGQLGLEPWEICRTGDAKNVGVELPIAKNAEHYEEWMAVLAAYPALIQRPLVVTDDGTAYVARDDAAVSQAIAAQQG
jgi:arsenate reductase (glutaredoxin)